MTRKAPTPKPRELAADWAAVTKKLPRGRAKPSQEYPEMAADWATLKNLPQYAYVLEWYFGDAMALHRVKVVAKSRKHESGWAGFIVAFDRTLFHDPTWKRSEHTPSKKADFIRRAELCFTRREVERAFTLRSSGHLDDLWQNMRRLTLVSEDVLSQLKYIEKALQRHRGVNEFYDALNRVPTKAIR